MARLNDRTNEFVETRDTVDGLGFSWIKQNPQSDDYNVDDIMFEKWRAAEPQNA